MNKIQNLSRVVTEDEMLMSGLNYHLLELRKAMGDLQMEMTEETGLDWVPWIKTIDLAVPLFKQELGPIADNLHGPSQGRLIATICRENLFYVHPRMRIAGNPATAVFRNYASFSSFMRRRPHTRAGRSASHSAYDRERQVFCRFQDGELKLVSSLLE